MFSQYMFTVCVFALYVFTVHIFTLLQDNIIVVKDVMNHPMSIVSSTKSRLVHYCKHIIPHSTT